MRPGKKADSIMVGVHVDDLIVTGRPDYCKCLPENLEDYFPTKNLRALLYYLGCEYVRDYEQKTLLVSKTA